MSTVAKSPSPEVAPAAQQLVRLFHTNPAAGPLQHGEYILQKSGSALVPKAVANLWLTYTAYGNAVCTQQEPAPAVVNPVNVALATENDELKVRLANLEKALHEARANPSGKTLSDLGSTPSPEEIAEAAETPKTTSKKK